MFYKTLTCLALSYGALVAADHPGLTEDPDTHPAQALESAAENHLDVPYLGESRDTLTWGGAGSGKISLRYRSRINVYVPPGDGPFPCFIYVHGGGYGEGHATRFQIWNERPVDGRKVDPRQLGMERGYVLVMLNYILKQPHVQVQRDFKEAVRFLRANAATYHIDPNRMAALGGSAGGWLITSAGLTTADDYGHISQQSMPLATWPDGAKWKLFFRKGRRKEPGVLMSSFDELAPRHPAISARLNALVFDFCHQLDATTPDDPKMLCLAADTAVWWSRKGKVPQQDLLREKLTLMDFGKFNAEALTHKGKLPGTLHVPPSNMLVPGLDGKPITAVEYIFNWLDQTLRGEQAMTPTPEAHPNRRIFKESVSVTFAKADAGNRIHYTLDGSPPTTASPVADKPLTLDKTTTVKFIAVADGMQPSPVASATFIKATPLPRVTAPTEPVLPIATVGQPYEVQFASADAKVWFFRISGVNPWQSNPLKKEGKEGFRKLSALEERGNIFEIGLDADPATGRLFGTPTQPGTYPLQVMTALDRNAPAECRTYNLVVLPAADDK